MRRCAGVVVVEALDRIEPEEAAEVCELPIDSPSEPAAACDVLVRDTIRLDHPTAWLQLVAHPGDPRRGAPFLPSRMPPRPNAIVLLADLAGGSWAAPLLGQDRLIRTFDQAHRLDVRTISAVAQDSLGYLWIGGRSDCTASMAVHAALGGGQNPPSRSPPTRHSRDARRLRVRSRRRFARS